MEDKWRQALNLWTQLREANSHHLPIWLREFECAVRSKNQTHAAKIIELIKCKFDNTGEIEILEAQLSFLEGNSDDSSDKLLNILNSYSHKPHLIHQSGLIFFENSQYTQALECFKKLLSDFPQVVNSYMKLYEIYMIHEQYSEALEIIKLCCMRFPENILAFNRLETLNAKLSNDVSNQSESMLNHEQNLQNSAIESILYRKKPKKIEIFINILITKVYMGLKSEVQQNYLSYAWWLLEPLMQITIYYFVFVYIFQVNKENYLLFLLCGKIPWLWFSKSLNSCGNSILGGKSLLMHIQIHPILFPSITIMQIFLKEIPVFILLFSFLIFSGFYPTFQWFWVIALILLQILLIFGLGCILACIVPFIRDVMKIIPTLLMMGMFVSGVFFDISSLSGISRSLISYNPMAFIIDSYRAVLIENSHFQINSLIIWYTISFALIAVVYIIFTKLRWIYPRVITQ